MCVCVRLVKTEMRKTAVRVYGVSISEPPGVGPQPGGRAAFPFLWTSTLCLVGPDQERRAEGLSHQPPSFTPLLSMSTEPKLMFRFTGMTHHGDIESSKRGQSKKRTTRVVAQCQQGVPMHRRAVACAPRGRRSKWFCLSPARCTWGQLGQAHGSTSSKHLHVGISQRPPGNKFPEGRLHFLAAHFLMLHLPCSTLLSLTVCSVWCGFSYSIGALGLGVVQRQMLPVGPHIWWRYSGEVCWGYSPADALKLSQGAKPLLKTSLSYEPPLDPICNPPALSTATALFAHG